MPHLVLHQIGKRFGHVTALDSVSVELPSDSHSLLIGPSGSGKSTLLRILAGLETPDHGSVRADGQDLVTVRPEKRGFGWVAQNPGLLPHLDVLDQIALPLRLQGMATTPAHERAAAMARELGLGTRLHHTPAQLSGGEAARVALGRALVHHPRLLLLDEPFAHLDLPLRHEMRRLLERHRAQYPFACIHATHHPNESLVDADLIVCLDAGRLTQADAPDRAYRQPATPWLADMLGRDPVWLCTIQDAARRGVIGLDSLSPPEGHLLLGLRPESFELHATKPAGASLGPATIRRVRPAAASLQLVVELPDGTRLPCTTPARPPIPAPGDIRWLGFDPDQALWFPSR